MTSNEAQIAGSPENVIYTSGPGAVRDDRHVGYVLCSPPCIVSRKSK